MKYGFGVDLGGTSVKIAYFNEEGTLLDKWEIPTDVRQDGVNILPDIARSLQEYVNQKQLSRESLLGIGIGVPGPVDDEGVVNCCENLGWGVFNVHDALGELTGLPVKAGNDANVAALGECWKGSGKGSKNMMMVTLGTGVGGGLVADGKIVAGAHGAAGEFGHLVLNREETEPCGCGKKGCAEQYCSATGVARLAQKRLERDAEPSVLRTLERVTARDVFDSGKAGDKVAVQVLEQYFAYLGEFLADVCCVFDPEKVILGGGVCKAGQFLLDGMMPHYLKNVFHASRGVKFAIASLGNDAGTYGAFKLALDAFG